ncbi:hypothetical protein IAQ61_005742 [Plenodomus lingam]|uniref:uncharacterized protein n=1 Tax=Leptosphaeria maculans TaxID=5022 RepID=UPI0033169AC0|nr:hypothetical protein IAQ61_005742 [Plenodomus lingam]
MEDEVHGFVLVNGASSIEQRLLAGLQYETGLMPEGYVEADPDDTDCPSEDEGETIDLTGVYFRRRLLQIQGNWLMGTAKLALGKLNRIIDRVEVFESLTEHKSPIMFFRGSRQGL